ncbi:DUF6350 family protein [Bifidobacterium sp. ESL0682]|uniref:cell division protein PerM n=1 Tax=Bifidobacterium sp. ESL0682 TaxID=2983212 RepID=UPI0023F90BBB|nr:DUF6350 family protein [Bifidobacterium sp. ESL0682]WEV42644.1 DUF6350 family protein [Bifidobacterium sp. ESL0682]
MKGLVIALGGSMIFTITLGLFMALTLLMISMEEGGGTLSNFSVSLTLAVALLCQGAGFHASSITVTIIPLLLTALLIWLVAWLTRKLSTSPKAYVAGLLSWVAIMWIFTQNVVVLLEDPVWMVLAKTAIFFTLGFLIGAIPGSSMTKTIGKFITDNVSKRLSDSLKLGLLNAVILILGYLVIGLITVIVWAVTNQSAMVRVFNLANMQTGSRIMTTICTLGWLPNLCLWALSWLFGSGFSIGDLASFSLWHDHALGLPAVPVFAIFPQALSNDTLRLCLMAIPLVCGCLLTLVELFLPRCFAIGAGKPDEAFNVGKTIGQFVYPILSFCLTSGLMAIVMNILFTLSSGALGQHRLAHVGVDTIASSRVVCLPSTLGFSLAWLISVVVIALVFASRMLFDYLRSRNAADAMQGDDNSSADHSITAVSAETTDGIGQTAMDSAAEKP